jgi:serine/threonine protein kinase
MTAQIILEVIAGSLNGERFVFDNIITTLIGRNVDCFPKLPNDDTTASRYHCLLDINPLIQPPQVRIRDYGSYTGTYLNGENIGQRPANQSPEASAQAIYLFHSLKTGDEVRLGKTKLRVSIEILSDDRPASAQVMISSTTPAFLNSPPQISGYTISKELGRGGFGVVYLAHCERLKQQVALKIICPHKQANENARKKFLREIEVSQHFNHPHIVQVLDAGEEKNLLFLALEVCPHGTVKDLLSKSCGRLPLDVALHIIYQTLDGLEYAHNLELPVKQLPNGVSKQVKGIVHRDLKPENIFCASEGHKPIVKVADFGLAKAFDLAGISGYTSDNSNSENPSIAGTLAFMPRQQVLDFKYSKPEVDVWAAAACLYQMLTGRLPRDFSCSDGSLSNLCRIILETSSVPIRRYNAEIPPRLAATIDLALNDQPSLNFKSVAEFKQALDRAYS